MLDIADTPALSAEAVALGILIVELEKLHPGLSDRLVTGAEEQAVRAQVIRLRGTRATGDTLRVLDRATSMLQMVSSVAKAAATPIKRGWGR